MPSRSYAVYLTFAQDSMISILQLTSTMRLPRANEGKAIFLYFVDHVVEPDGERFYAILDLFLA